jgi:hypothetical protein
MESTVIAQCLVWCTELFYVRNVQTGRIVQGTSSTTKNTTTTTSGNNDETPPQPEPQEQSQQNVPHLVRMERTVLTTKDVATGKFHNNLGDWIITDIDDLLGGNLVV